LRKEQFTNKKYTLYYHSLVSLGLRYDDLIAEESELVQEALRRFEIAEPRAAYDRAYRIRVAQQCSLSHQLLSKDKWVTESQVNDNSNNNLQAHN
jgi:Arc/MetJ family transcription regulator